jgi:hypothetical protein
MIKNKTIILILSTHPKKRNSGVQYSSLVDIIANTVSAFSIQIIVNSVWCYSPRCFVLLPPADAPDARFLSEFRKPLIRAETYRD